MRIIDKNRIEKIKEAVVDVSGYSSIELELNRNHTVTPWASLGMYLITKEGETAKNASAHYGRRHGAVHVVTRKIESDLEKYQPHLDKILERVKQCG